MVLVLTVPRATTELSLKLTWPLPSDGGSPLTKYGAECTDGGSNNGGAFSVGTALTITVPALVKVPVGKYEIRTMQDGKILSRQDVEVTSSNHSVVTVKKQ